MNKGDQTTTDVVKLTLHNVLDAKLIAILDAMPKGHKARLIADALLAVYDVGHDGQLKQKTQPAPSSVSKSAIINEPDEPDARPTTPTPAPKPNASKPKTAAKTEVEIY